MSVLLAFCSLLGLAMSVDGAQLSSVYLPAKGFVIRPAFRGPVISVRSELDCVRSQCSGLKPCAVAFQRQSGQCVGVAVPDLVPLLAATGVLFSADSDSGWTTFVSEGVEVRTDGAAALWLLDSESRGRNLGVKGEPLDMTETGLQWISTGPRGAASSRKYARLTSSNRATVQLLHDGEYALNLSQPFTMATWVRTDDVEGRMAIIDGKIDSVGGYKVHFWFFADLYQKQIYLSLGHDRTTYMTTLNADGRLEWRHVAVVYEGGSNVRFFLNGQKWMVGGIVGSMAGAVIPQSLEIGYRSSDGTYGTFLGSVACMCIYQRAVTAEELRRVMDACP